MRSDIAANTECREVELSGLEVLEVTLAGDVSGQCPGTISVTIIYQQPSGDIDIFG